MESRQKNSDEIDLLYFFNPVFTGVKKVGAASTQYVGKLTRNIVIFLVIFFLIAGISYALRFVLPAYYKTTGVFVSYNMPSQFCSDIINELDEQIQNNKSSKILAGQIQTTVPVAASIKSVSSVPEDSTISLLKIDSTAEAFKVTIVLREKTYVQEVQESIENYLEKNSFAVKRIEANRKSLVELRNDLISRIANLDSLKNILISGMAPRSMGQGIILGEPVSPIEAYEVQREYFKELIEIDQKLSLLKNIEVVQPFLIFNNPNLPDFNKIFMFGILIAFFAALIFTPLFGRR